MFTEVRLKRLQELGRQRPFLAEIIDFYTHLYAFFAAERDSFLQATIAPENLDVRRKEGFPLLNGGCLEVDRDKAAAFLTRLIEIFRRHGRGGAADLEALHACLATGEVDLSPLFRAALDRDRQPLLAAAEKAAVPPPLLEFVVTTALGFALQRCRQDGLTAATDRWDQGYCPLCGGVPVMGALAGEEGRKTLQCGTCGTSWEHPRLTCSHCGNHDHQTLEYFTAEGEPAYRVNICRQCSCYLKVADRRGSRDEVPLDIEDLATLHLDLLAEKEGFTRGKRGTAG